MEVAEDNIRNLWFVVLGVCVHLIKVGREKHSLRVQFRGEDNDQLPDDLRLLGQGNLRRIRSNAHFFHVSTYVGTRSLRLKAAKEEKEVKEPSVLTSLTPGFCAAHRWLRLFPYNVGQI